MAEKLLMPALSPTMEEGLLVKWLKEEGDFIEEGDAIAEVETDKATMELTSFFEGTLLKKVIQEQESVPVEGLVAIIGEVGESIEALLNDSPPTSETPDAAPNPPAAENNAGNTATPEAVTLPPDAGPHRLKVSPLARKMAGDQGLKLSDIKGSGPQGRIIKRDIEAAIEAAKVATTPITTKVTAPSGPIIWPEDVEPTPLSGMRRTIARRLGESWTQAPHFFLEIGIRMDALFNFRRELNAALSRSDAGKISFNDLVVKACAMALQDHPAINSAFADDGMRQFAGSHIGVAVAVPEGLVVPVLRDAELKSLRSISTETRALAKKARNKRLTPQEMSGATFSISNLGMFGIERFTAIINAPAACILAVGAIRKVPVVNDEGTLEVGQVMQVTLSCDHRAVDGAVGARFLNTLKTYLEEPLLLVS